RLNFGVDGTYSYIQSFGSNILFLNQQGNHTYVGEWLVFANNFGHGIVGLYDPAKYRMVYAIGLSYLPAAGGTSIAGFYGLTFIYEDPAYINPSAGASMGHSVALVDNGSIKSLMGTNGFWTSGKLIVAGSATINGGKLVPSVSFAVAGTALPASP